MRAWFVAGALIGALTFSSVGFAQQTDTALAETLYQQARALMDEKHYDEACQKFAESQRLDPATGTLLNLAACNEARGKLATAWAEYTDAVVAARRDQREDRVTFARERIAAIEPKLARVTVLVPGEADVNGLEIRLDGVLIGKASRGVPAPTDIGKHTIEATAPGKKTWSQPFDLKDAEQKSLRIPLLGDGPAPPPSDESESAQHPIVGPDRVTTERPTPSSVYIAGATTAVLAIGAGVTGALFMDKKGTYNDRNRDSTASTSAREDARDSARTWGVVNGVFVIATIGGAATTAYLYFTRPEVKRTARIAPWVSPTAAGISITGVDF